MLAASYVALVCMLSVLAYMLSVLAFLAFRFLLMLCFLLLLQSLLYPLFLSSSPLLPQVPPCIHTRAHRQPQQVLFQLVLTPVLLCLQCASTAMEHALGAGLRSCYPCPI